jgi:hypothetical protein
MSDEFDRLRDVARAAAALIRADDESLAHMRGWRDRTEPPPIDEIREGHRLSEVYFARRAELVAALAQLDLHT